MYGTSIPRLKWRTAEQGGTHETLILTRSHTPDSPPTSCNDLIGLALKLRERVDLSPQQRYRLVGVGLSNFQEVERTVSQPELFE
jgi:DNA polymerase IV